MKCFVSASEIIKIGLKCLPTTKAAILARATAERWSFKEVKGLGGTRKEFKLPKYALVEMKEKGLLPESVEIEKITDDDIIQYHDFQDYLAWSKTVETKQFIPIKYYDHVYANPHNHNIKGTNLNSLMFRFEFIDFLGVDPKNLICIKIHDNSMHPTIKVNGIAMFDLSCEYQNDGIYLIRLGNHLKVKRLQKITANKMILISDNQAQYQSVEIDMTHISQKDFSVLGKYLWDAGVAS